MNKGIDVKQSEKIINSIEIDWITIGIKQFNKKFSSKDLNDFKKKNKIFNSLIQKGFSHQEIKQIISLINQ